MANQIHPTAVIDERVIIGDNVYIGPNCTIGFPAEYKNDFGKDTGFTVEIADNATITGNVTIDAGTVRNTKISSHCLIMKGCHIGHDAILEENVTLSPHACVGGHVIIGDSANLGMACIIHPRKNVGAYSMIGMATIVTKKSSIKPGHIYVGSPAKELGLNKIGLERNQIDDTKLQQLITEFERSDEY